MTEQLVPEIRFQGFIEGWTRAALGAVAQLNPATTIPEEFQYVDLASVVGTQMISHRRESRATAPSRAQRLAREGDIFYQTVRPYQKNNVVFEGMSEPFVFSSGYAQIRTHLPSGYLFSAMQRPEFVNQVLDRCTGTSFPAISPTALGEVQVPLCGSLEEQRSIASTFVNLDDSIAQHQRKHRQLQQAKASLMQRMFPAPGANEPEIRFEGFSGKWEQRRLGDVATFINGRAYSQPELLSHGKYPVLRVGNFYTNSAWYYSDLELNEKCYANTGDLLYTWSASFGPHIWTGGKVIFHYHIWRVELSNALDKLFALQLLEKHRDSILAGHNGSTMAHITKEGMEDKSVLLAPSVAEQQAVGAFFSKLDDLIEAQAQYVSKLQQVKAALLQKMFI